MNPSLWGACVPPLPWQVLSQGLVFLGSGLFFQKISESSVCFRAMVWGSEFHLTSWQDGSVGIWTECPAVPNPFPFPRSCCCPAAAFKTQVQVADAFMGWCLLLCPGPRFCLGCFSLLCVEGEGKGRQGGSGGKRWAESSIMQNEFLLPSEPRK